MSRIVVITGAAGVLCEAIAEHFAKKGDKVMLLDINEAKVIELEKRLKDQGFNAKGYKANVLDKQSLIDVKNQIVKTYGVPDILINGAGGNNPRATTDVEFHGEGDGKNFFSLETDGVDFVFNLNFKGTFLTTQIFAEEMVNKKGANIINISSMNAFSPLTKIPAYSAAKSAVSNFTEWLAVYFAKTGIRVNAIAPGFFATNQNKTLLFNPDGSLTERSKKIINKTPMGRFGEPKEILGTLSWLCDNEASGFITGVVIPIDGGFNAYSGV